MGAVLLSVRGCSFGYRDGTFHLHCDELDVSAGEVVGIVGPNGSGKSTLLRLMCGLLEPSEGEVRLDGRPVRSFSRRALARRMAFLPQEPDTSFRFTVRQVVAMGRYPYQGALGFVSRRDVEAVEAAMRRTATEQLAERRFFTLSGGEKQRALVAAVLAQEPSAMLLDEPAASLDIHHRAGVFDLLWSLSRGGIAVVLVTHDLNSACQFCDRLVLLSEGRLARTGAPAEVMDAQLLSAVYDADVKVTINPVTSAPMAVVPGRSAHAEGRRIS